MGYLLLLMHKISVDQQSIDKRKLLKDNNGKIEFLKDISKIPKNKRKRETNLRVIDYIVIIRKKYPRMGKDKIKVLLNEYCKDSDIKSISSSTIGRIIKERNLFFYPKEYTHFGKEKRFQGIKKLRRKNYKLVNLVIWFRLIQ